ncbi:unnamed protein product [Diplocarpon coronariae]
MRADGMGRDRLARAPGPPHRGDAVHVPDRPSHPGNHWTSGGRGCLATPASGSSSSSSSRSSAERGASRSTWIRAGADPHDQEGLARPLLGVGAGRLCFRRPGGRVGRGGWGAFRADVPTGWGRHGPVPASDGRPRTQSAHASGSPGPDHPPRHERWGRLGRKRGRVPPRPSPTVPRDLVPRRSRIELENHLLHFTSLTTTFYAGHSGRISYLQDPTCLPRLSPSTSLILSVPSGLSTG